MANDDRTARPALNVVLAEPRGFCAGVERAIQIVENALTTYGAPVYVRHEIVHNAYVVEDLKSKGAIFVEELDEIPTTDQPVIFSAHGVPKSVPEDARSRNMFYVDATCPLVSKVHIEATRHHEVGHEIILIGHAGHPEVIGTIGQLPEGAISLVENLADAETIEPRDPDQIAYVTQTTLSIDDTSEIVDCLRRRFPKIAGPHKEDICYATTNRQAAVKAIAPRVDALVVVGAPNSSNSRRLVEVAIRAGCPRSFLVEGAHEIDWSAMGEVRAVGVTAGASAPEILVEAVIDAFRARFDVTVETVQTAREDVVFKLPREVASVTVS